MKTHPGNKLIKFCSSVSCTSRTMYWKLSGKRGRTENASFASRMHTLEGEHQARGSVHRGVKPHRWLNVHMCDAE